MENSDDGYEDDGQTTKPFTFVGKTNSFSMLPDGIFIH